MAHRTYSIDFKSEAAKLVARGGGLKATAASLGVAPSTLRYWVQAYAAPAAPQPRPSADLDGLRAENERLRKENERLRMEREILKKATAFFARENQ